MTPANTVITNTAVASYTVDIASMQQSDSATFTVESIDGSPSTPSTLELLHSSNASAADSVTLQASECATSDGSFVAMNEFNSLRGAPVSLPADIGISPEQYGFKVGEPVILRLEDFDRNLNPVRLDQITVDIQNGDGSDVETIRLTESDINSGVFYGVLNTVAISDTGANYDCALSVRTNETISATYTDPDDNTDLSTDSASFDPYSRVFNAVTGELINGVVVRVIDAETGEPATVYEDDGTTFFPSEVTTGSAGNSGLVSAAAVGPNALTASATVNNITFPDGSFRFPYLRNGTYRLEFDAPAIYQVPSVATEEDIARLGGNFSVNGISYGDTFTVNNHVFAADIPADPLETGVLLSKRANTTSAAVGDFVRFSVGLSLADVPLVDGQLEDRLPVGMTYQPGSANFNGEPLPDPVISSNGRTMLFDIPDVAAEASATLDYVVQVGTNARGTLTNEVSLIDETLSANTATARVDIEDEFFREKSRLYGRVYIGDCSNETEQEGVADVRLFLEDGTYVVTDENGEWHIEDVTAGAHVVQLDTITVPGDLELQTCDNLGFHAGRNFSQFVDIQPGSLWRVDFTLKRKQPPEGELTQKLTQTLEPLPPEDTAAKALGSPVNQQLGYQVRVTGEGGLPIQNVIQMISLPDGVVYRTGSTLINGEPALDPEVMGNTLVYRLGDKPVQFADVIEFKGIVSSKADDGELVTRSATTFDIDGQTGLRIKPVTTLARLRLPPPEGVVKQPEQPKFKVFFAELSEQDKLTLDNVVTTLADLQDIQLEVVGHTDSTRIAPRSRHIFADNKELSEARAGAVADYLQQKLDLSDEQITSSGEGQSQPIASNDNPEGRSLNRRVEVKLLAAKPKVKLESVGAQIETERVQASLESLRYKGRKRKDIKDAEFIELEPMPVFDDAWFRQHDTAAEWVWPELNKSPSISATSIAIKHPADQSVKLFLDGSQVSMLNMDQIFRSSDKRMQVTTWKGVDIQSGANRFRVEVFNQQGELVDTINSRVQLAESPARAVFLPEQSDLVADGINTPVVAVQLFDKDGYPIRANLQAPVAVAAPYALYSEKKQSETAPLLEDAQPMFSVGRDGIARIRLAPTNRSGEAELTFNFSTGQTDTLRVWLKPQPREWILVGLGDMTVGYNQSSGDLPGRKAAGIDDNIYHDGRVAFYAQGQVAGDWLLTAAYDSARPESEAFSHMIDANKYYTLYGDASEQNLDASSGKKLYVKIERNRFYAMFGDIDTGLDQTELGEYNRRMTGLQTEYQGTNVEATAFVAQTDNGFVRDEIQGDGTSGLYRLSREHLVSASESITLEVRDRYRSEVIVSSTPLIRDYDYVIDYQDGTIYFKQPIRATDENFNPRYIVAEYEVDGEDMGFVAGGRAGVKFLDDRLKAGISVVNQNQPDHHGQMKAIDTRVRIGSTEILAEVGQSEQSRTDGEFRDQAHLVEVNHRSESVQAKVYIRRQGANYGVDDVADSENGLRKEGMEATWYLGDHDNFRALLFHHHDLETGFDNYQSQLEWTHAMSEDRRLMLSMINAQSESTDNTLYTDQAGIGIAQGFFRNRLQLGATLLTNISTRSDADDQMLLTGDYKFSERTSMFSAFETGFSSAAAQRLSVGVRTAPWQGATAEQSIEQVKQDDAYQLMALSGLVQEFSLTDTWTASLGFDQAVNLRASLPDETSDTTEDYYAMYAGISYNTLAWQWNNRLEYRDGDQTDKWVANSGLYHPISDTLSTGASIDYFRSITGGAYDQQTDAMFDLALRPQQSRYAILLQTRWVQSASGDVGAPDRTRKLINNIHGNWVVTDNDQVSGQYGIKRTLSQFNSQDYAATVDFSAVEWRHHFSKHWDIGAHGRRLHAYEAGQSSHGLGMSVGWIPKSNAWLGLGYNMTGFIDDDFSAANFTAKGPFIKIRIKADQNSLIGMRSAFY